MSSALKLATPGGQVSKGCSAASNDAVIAPFLLTDAQAAQLYGVGLTTLQEMINEPWFPPPVVLGPRLRRHVLTELQQAAASMPRQTSKQAQPAELARARIERMKSSGVSA